MNYIAISALIIAAIGAYFFLRSRKNSDGDSVVDVPSDVIDSEFSFDEVVSFFQSKQLNQEVHLPFIANGDCAEFKKMFKSSFPKSKDGYVSLFLGVYNSKTDKVEDMRLVYAKSLDAKTLEVLGNEKLVVLN